MRDPAGAWKPYFGVMDGALFHAVVSQPNFWMNYQRRGPLVSSMAEH